MEIYQPEDVLIFKFKEIQTSSRTAKLRFASEFLTELHNEFADILKFSAECNSQTTFNSNVVITNHAHIFTNDSFTTSTPITKGRSGKNTSIPNRHSCLSPLNLSANDSKQDKFQKNGGKSKGYSREYSDEDMWKYKNKNGHKMQIIGKCEVEAEFNLNDSDFPSISEVSKPKRQHTIAVSNYTKKDEFKDSWTFQKSVIPIAGPSSSNQDHASSTCTKPAVVELAVREVTGIDQLNVLADIYAYFINDGLAASAMNELCIIIQLLTLNKKEESDKTDQKKYFTSLSNIVHFSCRVLQNMHCFIELADQETLKLLAENERLRLFAPELIQVILERINFSSHEVQIHDEEVVCGGITFDEDKDTRSNFPSNNAFNTFKKQRDMFYQLLREWEKEHLSIGWSIKMKVETINSILVGCQPTFTDQLRFVQLFVSQLIKTCSSKPNKENSTLSVLMEVNPDKLKRLQGRLVASPPPEIDHPNFPKDEEFFKDFIALSLNNSFCALLILTLYSKVEEFSNSATNLICNSSSNCDTTSSFQTGFLNHIVTLQVLGKFLGFVTFLPFRSGEKLTKADESDLLFMRNKLPSKIDIVSTLRQNLHKDSLVVGLSWTLNYLSLMDRSAIHLESTQSTLKFLFSLHHSAFTVCPTIKSKMCALTLRMLGWFFQLDIIPRDIFYESPSTFEGIELERLHTSLDQNLNISNEVIYRCQPLHLEKMCYLLRHSNSVQKSEQPTKFPLRKINPKSAPLAHSLKNDWSFINDVQKKLTKTLFQMHSSMKKIFDCVFDKIFVNWINHFQKNLMQVHLEKTKEFAKDVLDDLQLDLDEVWLTRAIKEKAEELSDELHKRNASTEKFCEDAIQVLKTLLSETSVQEVLSVFISIYCSNFKDKAFSWLKENLLPDIFYKEIVTELNRKFQQDEKLHHFSIHFDKSNHNLNLIHNLYEKRPHQSKLISEKKPFNHISMVGMKGLTIEDCDSIEAGNKCNSSLCSMSFGANPDKSLSTHYLNKVQKDHEKPILNGNQSLVTGDRTKTIKVEEDMKTLLPSEIIMSIQELLISLETNPTHILIDQVSSTLDNIESVLANQHKTLHPHPGNILYYLVASLAITIIFQEKTMWDEFLEKKLLSLLEQCEEKDVFEQLSHTAGTNENQALKLFVNKVLK